VIEHDCRAGKVNDRIYFPKRLLSQGGSSCILGCPDDGHLMSAVARHIRNQRSRLAAAKD